MVPLIILSMGIITAIYAQELSYEQLINTATKNSYRLKLGLTDIKIEQSRLDTLYSGYYPTLSVGYNLEYNKKLNSSGANGSASIGDTVIYSGDTYEDSLSLRMNYELYHFGTTDQNIQMQRREIQIKTLARCIEENKLHNELLDNYADALKAHIEYSHKDAIKTIRKELYAIKERLFVAGKESRISVADEAIEIINLERDSERAKIRYDASMLALGNLSTLTINPKEDTLALLTPSSSSVVPAFQDSIEAQSYNQRLLQKEHEISMHLRSQLPVVSAYGNYYMYGSDNSSARDAFGDMSSNSWNAGIGIRWDLFAGFKYNSEAERLQLEKQRISQEYELRRSQYDSEMQTIVNQTYHLSQLELHENTIVEQTAQKIQRVSRLRASGESDAITELTSKIELFERQLNLKIEQTQIAYQQKVLELRNKGVKECKGK